MSVTIDFYELLNVDRDAEVKEIEKSLKKQISLWRKRTEVSNLSVRQEAERRMELLGEAKRILLDQRSKEDYDNELKVRGVQQVPVVSDQNGTIDWIEEARQYVENNKYSDALYATQMALNSGISTPELWYLRSRANGGLGEFNDALYEAKRAESSAPNDAKYVHQIADLHMVMENYPAALEAFEKASKIDPSELFFKTARTVLLSELSQHEEALALARSEYKERPDNEDVRELLLGVLMNACSSKLTEAKNFPATYVDNEKDWAALNEYIEELKEIGFSTDEELASNQRKLYDFRDDSSRNVFAPVFYIDTTPSKLLRWDPETFRGKTLAACSLGFKLSFIALGLLFLLNGNGILAVLLIGVAIVALMLSYKPSWKAQKQWAEAMNAAME
ncbi:hypothetical protein [Corynebacterium freiburgense]|uniref:hypothetical protein n=1 Tax=Corynebacterium freiburgense TaxID=556548 RepID=UPI00040F4487|nr:hypothetical protein [Corynebacterium freiburgense]WJZ03081.1 Tetratricopeptide repeat protein [Corynebacterium freiburgense]